MALEKRHTMTIAEYFRLEDNSDRRYEYEDDAVYALPDSSINHATISSNLYLILRHLLSGKECRAYSCNMRVEITEACYYHPDLTITCGPREPGTTQILRSPNVIVEVLAPETELADRARKWHHYHEHPTIEAYLLVDSSRIRAEIYFKQGDKWFYRSFERDDIITLESLDVQFPLMDAYIDVEFEELPDDDFDD